MSGQMEKLANAIVDVELDKLASGDGGPTESPMPTEQEQEESASEEKNEDEGKKE